MKHSKATFSKAGIFIPPDHDCFDKVKSTIEHREKQQECDHKADRMKLAQIAGDGRYCMDCGYHDYDFDD